MKTLIYLLAIVALAVSCNSTKNATDKNTTVSTAQNTNMPDTIYRLSVSFISIGAGTDKKAKQQYDQYIIQYEQKNKIKLNYEIVNWGREGEIDYCFKLSELNKNQQDQFVTETKEILKSSSLVRFKENTTCRQKRK
ncbi:MAG: hypothetical protein WD597_13735 [Balneolaceae bacterium]